MTPNETGRMDKKHKQLLTRDQARAEIRRQGLTIREWARQRNLNAAIVFEVLGGRKKGNYGEAHKAAVMLGIKDGVVN